MDDSYESKCAFIKWTLFSGRTLTCLFLVTFVPKLLLVLNHHVFVITQNGQGDKGQHLVCVCHLLTLLCTAMKKKIPRGNADTAPLNPQPYEIWRICNLESIIFEPQSLAVSSTDIPKKNGDFFRIATFSAKKYTTAHKCKTLAKNFNLPFNQGQSELCSLAFAINIDLKN